MTRTVLMASQPGDAGVAHVVADQVTWARGAGWRVVVACDARTRAAELVEGAGGDVADWRARRSPGPAVPAELHAFSRVVNQVRPDLVHLHSSKAGLVGRLVVRGRLPTLVQPHAWSFDAAANPVIRGLARRWEREAVRWTTTLVCVSEAEREAGRRAGVVGPTTVLRNTVDHDRFQPADRGRGRAALPTRLGVDAGTPLVVCLGRLCQQKGQDRLLRAWPHVTAAVPDARLLLVGDGPDRARLTALASAGVLLVGGTDDPVPWLQAADVVTLPSRWEGQALVLLEALACGVPVVASDIAANAETMPSTAGELVQADDPLALADALVARLRPGTEEARAAEGAAGRAHVIRHHDKQAAAAALLRLYGDLLPHKTRHAPSATAG